MSARRRLLNWTVALALLAAVAVAVAWWAGVFTGPTSPAGNSILVIAPYRYAGTWVFDDPDAGLHREPFVEGVPEMIDQMVESIRDAEDGFRLLFSAQPFPGHTHRLSWRRGDETGNWYYCHELDREGWICPALFRYYRKAPREIYIKAEAK